MPSAEVGTFEVFIDPHVQKLFNEYASAAVKLRNAEIGGLAKVEPMGDGNFICTDFHLMTQKASACKFDIDKEEVTKFLWLLESTGRGDEMPFWCSIIHSHPVNCGPSMSGVDVDQLKDFAEESRAFSLIASATKDGAVGNWAAHYYERVGTFGYVMLTDMDVSLIADPVDLVARKKIEDHVEELIEKPIVHQFTSHGWGGDEWYPSEYFVKEPDLFRGDIVQVQIDWEGFEWTAAEITEDHYMRYAEMDGKEFPIEAADPLNMTRFRVDGCWFDKKELQLIMRVEDTVV